MAYIQFHPQAKAIRIELVRPFVTIIPLAWWILIFFPFCSASDTVLNKKIKFLIFKWTKQKIWYFNKKKKWKSLFPKIFIKKIIVNFNFAYVWSFKCRNDIKRTVKKKNLTFEYLFFWWRSWKIEKKRRKKTVFEQKCIIFFTPEKKKRKTFTNFAYFLKNIFFRKKKKVTIIEINQY